jgi:hypothetical protein
LKTTEKPEPAYIIPEKGGMFGTVFVKQSPVWTVLRRTQTGQGLKKISKTARKVLEIFWILVYI